MKRFIKRFGLWIDLSFLKALKTMAQTAVGIITAASVMNEVDWRMVLSATLLSGVVSMLMSVDTLPDIDESIAFKATDTDNDNNSQIDNTGDDE